MPFALSSAVVYLYMGKRACEREEIVIGYWLASTDQAISG
jgi:hypothetical protein